MIKTLQVKLRDIFLNGGLLSSQLPNFEYRKEQMEMAEAVFATLISEKQVIIEAGTGVGKSLAYLIPLVMWLMKGMGERAIVSTYTKALQKQLFEKELPFLKKHISPQIRYALSFGSDNYVCLRRIGQARQYGLFDGDEADAVSLILEWVNKTKTGLRSEIAIDNGLWRKVKRESDMCHGRECRNYHSCFYQSAKAEERKAHIIITNHHLFFAHVASDYKVLPEAQCFVFDEAHEIESVASTYLGIEMSYFRFKHLLDSILSQKGKGLLLHLKWLDSGRFQEISSMVDSARKRAERFFRMIQEILSDRRTLRIDREVLQGEDLIDALSELGMVLLNLTEISEDEEEKRDVEAIAQRILLCRRDLQFLCYQEHDDFVYWISQEERTIRLIATPFSISDMLSERVFGLFSPVILTSATLRTGDTFDFIKDRLALYEADTRYFAAPFDFKRQAALYIPDNIPDPGKNAYESMIADQVGTLLKMTKGRTMVLFTSYALLNEVADMVDVDYRVLRQGEQDNYALLEEFRTAQPCALFGTYAFWQGVDLFGDILKCVIISKLPFAVPTEPVLEARIKRMASEGRDPFYEYQVPDAVITFRQGFGRLIRSRKDRGIVAVLDSRIQKRPYGKYFLRSLPEIDIFNDFKKIKKFLK